MTAFGSNPRASKGRRVNGSGERVQGTVATALDEILEAGKLLTASGDLSGALRHFARALPEHGSDGALLAAAAESWVAAADQMGLLEGCPDQEREFLQRFLIQQASCPVSPPILHHRIAAQHSGGVVGHLGRAALALEQTLEKLLADGDESPNVVLMLLLLRDKLRRIDQTRISMLHHLHFARFGDGDLRIPYSVIFDRSHFKRNVADLSDYVRIRSKEILEGSVPLNNLLLLFWLVPGSFDQLPPDWPGRVLRARSSGQLRDSHEASAARSLVMRFDGDADRNSSPDDVLGSTRELVGIVEAVASERRTIAGRGGGSENAIGKLDRVPRQAAAAAWNMAMARYPALARRRRKPRAAVCVSGQLRGFRRSWETWRPLLAGLDATIFVSSWSRIGRGTPEPFRSVLPFEGAAFGTAYRAIGTEIGLDALHERYPALFSAFEDSGVVTEAELIDLYGTPHVELDDESSSPFAGYSNSEKMHYKIERCFSMAKASGKQFDVFIRIRPDKPITAVAFDWSDMLEAIKRRPLLYCETAMGVHYGALLMGDQFAVGAPEPFRLYAETWSRADKLADLDLYKFNRELTGHSSMAQLCWLHGIDVRKVPIKFGEFQEAQPFPATMIRQALAQDSEGRRDYIDERLIGANAIDLERHGRKDSASH